VATPKTTSTGSSTTPSAAAVATANAAVQQILAQIQQATNAAGNGSQPLTAAQAQAIVDAQNKALGIKN
jgi:hypothetical protein